MSNVDLLHDGSFFLANATNECRLCSAKYNFIIEHYTRDSEMTIFTFLVKLPFWYIFFPSSAFVSFHCASSSLCHLSTWHHCEVRRLYKHVELLYGMVAECWWMEQIELYEGSSSKSTHLKCNDPIFTLKPRSTQSQTMPTLALLGSNRYLKGWSNPKSMYWYLKSGATWNHPAFSCPSVLPLSLEQTWQSLVESQRC